MTDHERDYWKKALDKDAIIINGKCYHVEPDEHSYYGFQGCGGRKFIIEKNNGKRIVTRNLWAQGKIPKCLNVADNAKFVEA